MRTHHLDVAMQASLQEPTRYGAEHSMLVNAAFQALQANLRRSSYLHIWCSFVCWKVLTSNQCIALALHS